VAMATYQLRRFRDWPTLVAVLQALLPNPELDWQQVGSRNEPEQQGDHLMSP